MGVEATRIVFVLEKERRREEKELAMKATLWRKPHQENFGLIDLVYAISSKNCPNLTPSHLRCARSRVLYRMILVNLSLRLHPAMMLVLGCTNPETQFPI